jgi:hypothetical protein
MKTESKERRSRWSAWAAGLAANHRRLVARPPGLERVLARPREVGQILRERWLLASRHVQPQIHLAIQPVLRQTFWHSATVVRDSRPGGVGEAGRAAEPLPPIPVAPLQAVFQRLRAADPAPAPAGLASSSERAANVMPALALRAIETVFQRLHTAARREDGPADPRRIAQRLRRTEEPVFAPPPRVQRQAAPRTPEPAPAQPGTVPAWAAGAMSAPRSGPSWSAPVAPAIDVPALADRVMQQIGRRVEAWRERTGNL